MTRPKKSQKSERPWKALSTLGRVVLFSAGVLLSGCEGQTCSDFGEPCPRRDESRCTCFAGSCFIDYCSYPIEDGYIVLSEDGGCYIWHRIDDCPGDCVRDLLGSFDCVE